MKIDWEHIQFVDIWCWHWAECGTALAVFVACLFLMAVFEPSQLQALFNIFRKLQRFGFQD